MAETERKIALVTGAIAAASVAPFWNGWVVTVLFVVGTATTDAGRGAIQDAIFEQRRHRRTRRSSCASTTQLRSMRCSNSLKAESLVPSMLVNNAGVTRDNLLLRMTRATNGTT